jgi:hypothetical protein
LDPLNGPLFPKPISQMHVVLKLINAKYKIIKVKLIRQLKNSSLTRKFRPLAKTIFLVRQNFRPQFLYSVKKPGLSHKRNKIF